MQAGRQAYKQTNGRTDMTKLTVAFRNFAKAPKKGRMKMSACTFNSYSLPNTNEIIIKEELRGTYRTLEEMRNAFKIVVGRAEKEACHLEDVEGSSKWKT
jgi:hypothetical protein